MKLQIKILFEKEQDWQYDKYILQGFFYSLLKSGDINKIHNMDFGLFSFSNIFFEKDTNYHVGKTYNLFFKSPDQQIVNSIYEKLILKKRFKFGDDNEILIKKVFIVNEDFIYSGKTLKLQTPLVISLDKQLCENYGISYTRQGKPLYRNKNLGFDVFLKQLNKNLLRKYIFMIKKGYVGKLNDFDNKLLIIGNDIEKFDKYSENVKFFKGYKFKRGALVDYKGGKIAGTIWDFVVGNDRFLIKVLKYVSKIGFGERCSSGFGFIE